MGSATEVVRLPVLAPSLRKYVETPPFSFADSRLAVALDEPIDVNIELQRWLRRIYLEFRKLDLRVLLTDLKSSIRL
jgi:predicted nuclease with RNAse H fold